MKQVLFALGAMLASACTTEAVSPFPQDTRVVFVGERARELVRQCSRTSPGPVEGTWTPADSDLDSLESELPALIQRELHDRWPNDDARPLDYYRQYGGLVIAGQRIIYVSGFHRRLIEHNPMMTPRNPTLTWRDVAMQVCDGGPIVFGVEYNPRTRVFAHFAFNGAID